MIQGRNSWRTCIQQNYCPLNQMYYTICSQAFNLLSINFISLFCECCMSHCVFAIVKSANRSSLFQRKLMYSHISSELWNKATQKKTFLIFPLSVHLSQEFLQIENKTSDRLNDYKETSNMQTGNYFIYMWRVKTFCK